MLEDKDENLWFGTMGKGIYRYNGKTLDNFLNSNKQEYNLGENNQLILDILQDKNGNLWFSSWNGGGVWRFDGINFKTSFLLLTIIKQTKTKEISTIHRVLSKIVQAPRILHRKTISQTI
ncbi:MAG: hypothetical protein IPH04_12885 [Saprospirales bacterium]|nr:hypothetical protein [Saprospirales bacterium]